MEAKRQPISTLGCGFLPRGLRFLGWYGLCQLTFRTLFSRSMMVFEECSLAKRGLILSHYVRAWLFAPA